MERLPQDDVLFDGRAAALAGALGGLVLVGGTMLYTAITLDTPWLLPRIVAAALSGREVLPPASDYAPVPLVLAAVLSWLAAALAAVLLAVIIHRWGLIVGVLGGALYGLVVYALVFYGLALLLPLLSAYRSGLLLAAFIAYGAVAGGVYELLERDPALAPPA